MFAVLTLRVRTPWDHTPVPVWRGLWRSMVYAQVWTSLQTINIDTTLNFIRLFYLSYGFFTQSDSQDILQLISVEWDVLTTFRSHSALIHGSRRINRNGMEIGIAVELREETINFSRNRKIIAVGQQYTE